MRKDIFCGTYGPGGIYRITFEEGKLSDPVLYAEVDSPKYIAQLGNGIVSLCREGEKAGVVVLNEAGKVTGKCIFENVVSCFVASHEGKIVTANFHEGTFSLLKNDGEKISLLKKRKINEKAGCHMVLFHEGTLLGFALYMDRIYVMNKDLEIEQEIVFPEGTGPRHGIFSDDGRYLYVVSELSKEVFVLESGSWKMLDSVRLCDDEAATAAAIRLYEDRLYVSVRGTDEVYVIRIEGENLKVISRFSSGGKHPRDMIVVDGFVLCANMQSNLVSCVNEDGVISEISIPQAVTLIG